MQIKNYMSTKNKKREITRKEKEQKEIYLKNILKKEKIQENPRGVEFHLIHSLGSMKEKEEQYLTS
jgi:hypothetical protein